ncbi:hypothetical protein [Roseateles sp.]|uniref:hypothetical protein n=1 Tax=Roseateles sp. TaxID=1971397 RepID=UPI0031E42E88
MPVRLPCLVQPLPPIPVSCPDTGSLVALGGQLVGLGEWPADHCIRVHGVAGGPDLCRGRRAALTFGRIASARRVIDIRFDPETGAFECLSCQSTGLELPAWVGRSLEVQFVVAVLKGLTAHVAASLMDLSTLLSLWPQDPGAPPAGAEGPRGAPTLARCPRSAPCFPRCRCSTGSRSPCTS